MTEIAEKSILAKLLATENVAVEHRKVRTAYFDLENRTVVLPMLKEMTGDVYDLLIGHEVSHALNTPVEGWHSAVTELGSGFKSYLNVIEDARIERMIKDKYPGLRRSFYNGYKSLYNQDFFGITKMGVEVNKLKFIDRINLHFKVGNFLNIQFTDTEQVYLEKISNLQTWDDVYSIAKDLYDLAKSSKEEEKFQESLQDVEDMEFDDLGEQLPIEQSDNSQPMDSESETEIEEASDSDENSESVDSQETDSQEQSDPGSNNDGADTGDEFETEDEPSSETDKNFRANEDNLLDPNSRENTYNRLGKFNPADYVLSIDYFEKNLAFRTEEYRNYYYNRPTTPVNLSTFPQDVYREFLRKNGKFLTAMVQEFERKKVAKQVARAKTAKTGRINMDKVWAYKITEDLFLQNTIMPNGQNHGMIMYLDMSGSMRHNMEGTTEQLVLLASFCKKTRIPFEVYGFTASSSVPEEYLNSVASRNDLTDKKNLAIVSPYFRMIQMITTNANGNKFKRQLMNMLAYGKTCNFTSGVALTDESYRAIGVNSSTPLEEAIMVGRYLAEEFREKYRVEVLSSLFLTDGDGDCHYNTSKALLPYNPEAPLRDRYDSLDSKNNLVLTDAKTNITVKTDRTFEYNSRTNIIVNRALLALYKKATGSRMINFYVAHKKEARDLIRDMGYSNMISHENADKFYKKFRENGSVCIENVKGFDQMFVIAGGNDLTTEEDKIVAPTGATKSQLLKAFKKMQTNKTGSRAILSEMISAVA